MAAASNMDCTHCFISPTRHTETHQAAGTWRNFRVYHPTYVAKLFYPLGKGGAGSIGGGFRLAQPAKDISVLDVTDALEENKDLFDCKEICGNCVLYGDDPPRSETQDICSIHAVMIEAEQRMREPLAQTSLADLAGEVRNKLPAKIHSDRAKWFAARQAGRRQRGKTNS